MESPSGPLLEPNWWRVRGHTGSRAHLYIKGLEGWGFVWKVHFDRPKLLDKQSTWYTHPGEENFRCVSTSQGWGVPGTPWKTLGWGAPEKGPKKGKENDIWTRPQGVFEFKMWMFQGVFSGKPNMTLENQPYNHEWRWFYLLNKWWILPFIKPCSLTPLNPPPAPFAGCRHLCHRSPVWKAWVGCPEKPRCSNEPRKRPGLTESHEILVL